MTPVKDLLMEHFMNPRNVGDMENANGVGEVGNPICGDIIRFYVRVEGDVVKKASFKTFGCRAAIATSSILTELIQGKSVQEVLKITPDNIAEALGDLPALKRNCAKLGEMAAKAAIGNFIETTRGDDTLSKQIAERIHDAREWNTATFADTDPWSEYGA